VRPQGRRLHATLVLVGVVCAVAGVVLLGDAVEVVGPAGSDLLGATLVGAAVMALTSVALLRTPRR